MYTGKIDEIIINSVKGDDGSKPVQLTSGQVINVRVKEVAGDTALLSYQGQEIVAKLEADIPAGQQLRCLVAGENNGQLVLKVLNSEQEVLTPAAVKNILDMLGLQDDEANRGLIGQMVKMEMTLSRENARQLSAFMHAQKIPLQEAGIPVFIRSQGLPLTGEMFAGVKALLTDIDYLGGALKDLFSVSSLAAGDPEMPEAQKQLLTNLNQTIRNMQMDGQDSVETATIKLINLFDQLASSTGVGRAGQAPGMIPVPRQITLISQEAARMNGSGEAGAALPAESYSGQSPTILGQAGSDSTGLPGQAGSGGQPGQVQPTQGQPTQVQPTQAQPTQVQPTQVQPGPVQPALAQATQVQSSPGQISAGSTESVQGAAIAGELSQPGAGVSLPEQPQPAIASAVQGAEANRQELDQAGVSARTMAGADLAANQNEVGIQSGMPSNRTGPERISPETESQSGNFQLSSESSGSGKTMDSRLIDTIVQRLSEAAQNDPTLDSAEKEQFITRLRSVLDQSPEASPPKSDLLPILNNVMGELSQKSRHDNNDLLKLAQNVMDKLEMLRSFNNKAEPGRDNMLIMYSSVRFEEREEPLSLFVNYRYDGKNKQRDFKSCRMEVKLQTPNLGLIKCDVQVNYKNLNLQFTCDNENACKLVDSVKESLVEKLRQMNYQVTSGASKLDAVNEGQGLWLNDKPNKPGLFKINLRV